jgi:iron complex outermembrane receptor protein
LPEIKPIEPDPGNTGDRKELNMYCKNASAYFVSPLLVTAISIVSINQNLYGENKSLIDAITEEIIVTSDPVRSLSTDLPSSVSVIPNQALQNQGTESLAASLSTISNLNFAGGSNTPRFFQIRGIGELEQYEGAPNYSVGFFLDDFDLSGIGSGANTFDLQQLEVLRGPQGMAYGANALAGIIRLKTIDPSQDSSGQAKFSFGSDDLVNGGFALGGAVDQKTSVRLSIFNEQQDGFRHNQFLDSDQTNKRDTTQLYLKVRHQLSDDTTIDANLLRLDLDNGYDAFSIDNSFNTQSDRPGRDTLGLTAASIKLSNNLSKDYTLTSITSTTFSNQNYEFDGDWGNNTFWQPNSPYDYFSRNYRERDAFTQEVRVSDSIDEKQYQIGKDIRSLLGVYGQRFFENNFIDNQQNAATYDTLNSNYDSSTWAIFGQRETPLFTRTSITTGLRVEQKQGDYSDSRNTIGRPDDTMLGGNISVQHKLSEDTVYGLVSKGYRAGGVNTGIAVPEEKRVFDQENLWNYEAGIKGKLFNSKINSNLSVFYQKSIDAQVRGSYQLDPNDPLTFTYITDNAATADGRGVEWELLGNVTDRLSLQGQLALLRTNVESDDPTLLQDRDRSHSPRFSFSISPKYQIDDNWFGQFQVQGVDSFYFDDSHNQKSSAYNLFHASFGYEKEDYRITVWGRNLFNERYAVRGFFFGNEPPDFIAKEYIQLGDSRIFGVSFQLWF